MNKYLSTADFVIIVITAILFGVALFVKGLTQDLLLEVGILLISVKIISMNYSNKRLSQEILKKLEKMENTVGE
ncbi:MAG: hypothetical protein V2I47_02050 [Bacteroidales bacterium]|nr:hypothetical protein [Bacteroidales bacterium]